MKKTNLSSKHEQQAKVDQLVEKIAQECLKFCPPAVAKDNYTKSNAAINIVCLQAIRFKQKNAINLLSIIKTVKAVRRELKALKYNFNFINDISLYLIQAFMRTPRL